MTLFLRLRIGRAPVTDFLKGECEINEGLLPRRKRIVLLLAIAFLLSVPASGCADTKSLGSKKLRVAYLEEQTNDAGISPFGPGFDRELVLQFCHEHRIKPKWVEKNTWQKAFAALTKGKVDLWLAAGNQTSWAERKKAALGTGPTYLTARPQILINRQTPGVGSFQEICKRKIPIKAADRPVFEDVAKLSPCLSHLVLSPSASPEELLEEQSVSMDHVTMLDSHRYSLWAAFFLEVRPVAKLETQVPYAWCWGTRKKDLADALDAFWKKTRYSLDYRQLWDLYFGFLPDTCPYFQLEDLRRCIREDLPKYLPVILRASKENSLDPLFVVAMIYQESRFQPRARSGTGVTGLMQVTRQAAETIGVENIHTAEGSIVAGCRYYRKMMDLRRTRISPPGTGSLSP